MKSLSFLLLTFFSVSSFADTVCDFPYDLSEDEGVEEISSSGVDNSTKLSALQKNQIIITAKKLIESKIPEKTNIKWAINELASNSEGGDITYIIFSYQGKIYNLVQSYPGGNPYGLVFEGKKPVAARTDGDVSCKYL